MEYIIIYLLVLVTGACIGSFLNVVALRAITKESIVFPSSKCPVCNEHIKWYDNIPVFSYLFTFKGKCRNCGCKVSLQYPIVETLTSILFLAVFIAFGATLKTLILLILLCISIVLIITDIKKEYLYERHLWSFITAAVIYSVLYKYGTGNIFMVCSGIISGAIIMELIARGSYYLVRKDIKEDNKEEKSTEENSESIAEKDTEDKTEEKTELKDNKSDEDIDINEYVKTNKRAFGEGDTYLAAASGALLGVKMFIAAVFMAVIIQAICILPQFIRNLYKDGHKNLLYSISAFILLTILYFILLNCVDLNLYIRLVFIAALIYFAIYTIKALKGVVNKRGFAAIPFGPALLFSTFTLMFFGPKIIDLIRKLLFI